MCLEGAPEIDGKSESESQSPSSFLVARLRLLVVGDGVLVILLGDLDGRYTEDSSSSFSSSSDEASSSDDVFSSGDDPETSLSEEDDESSGPSEDDALSSDGESLSRD